MIQCDDINEPITVNEWWNLADEVYGLKKQFYEYWKDNSLDAILAPVWPSTASLPYGQPTINYTAPFNLCDCCSVAVSYTHLDVYKRQILHSPLYGRYIIPFPMRFSHVILYT